MKRIDATSSHSEDRCGNVRHLGIDMLSREAHLTADAVGDAADDRSI